MRRIVGVLSFVIDRACPAHSLTLLLFLFCPSILSSWIRPTSTGLERHSFKIRSSKLNVTQQAVGWARLIVLASAWYSSGAEHHEPYAEFSLRQYTCSNILPAYVRQYILHQHPALRRGLSIKPRISSATNAACNSNSNVTYLYHADRHEQWKSVT